MHARTERFSEGLADEDEPIESPRFAQRRRILNNSQFGVPDIVVREGRESQFKEDGNG